MDNDTESFPSVLSPHSAAVEPAYDDEFDEEFAPRPKAKLGAATVVLAALLLAGAGFVVGVYVQKHDGTTSTTGTNGAAAAFASRARAAGGTGFGGGTGRPGPVGGAGTGAAAATGAATPGDTSTPAVIGTVVSVNATTMVVKNFAGKEITVTLSGDTTVTKAVTAADLAAGQTVSVSGATGADGSVTASSVTAR